jgi:hypothetical protein
MNKNNICVKNRLCASNMEKKMFTFALFSHYKMRAHIGSKRKNV